MLMSGLHFHRHIQKRTDNRSIACISRFKSSATKKLSTLFATGSNILSSGNALTRHDYNVRPAEFKFYACVAPPWIAETLCLTLWCPINCCKKYLLFHDSVTTVYVFDRRATQEQLRSLYRKFFFTYQQMDPYCSHLDFRAKLIFFYLMKLCHKILSDH
jgi:hypothetical protein